MGAVVGEARAILDEFTRDGRLSRESLERARWGDWEQATPAWVLLIGLKCLVFLRWEEGRNGSAVFGGTPAGLPREHADALVEVLRGNLSAARAARAEGLLTLDRVLALLVTVLAAEAMTHEEIGVLLESAEAILEEALQAGELLRPSYRGIDVGPWDTGERGWRAADLIDLGGLKVPRMEVGRMELNRSRSGGEYVEAVLVRDRTASLQLQAFRTSGEPEWERTCDRLASDVRARGGDVERWSGRAGVELRAVVRVVGDARGRDRVTVRFIGCDGPGWLLRGVVGGEVARHGSRDDWAYRCFESVVVDASFTGDAAAVSTSPTSYSPSMPHGTDRTIPVRFPD
ncbi:DUF3710 domain-containing protein [Streptomyces sp. NPDC004126]|uniref:DUF3710 domain-containing protein n=1 Tax=Streptomyces sp. NPDC004126 TaxID=3390695 RepID=UPI003CFDEC71